MIIGEMIIIEKVTIIGEMIINEMTRFDHKL